MKRIFIIFFSCILVFSSVVISQDKKEKKKEDPLKHFYSVEKPLPVPDNMKTGFESITGKDASAYLKFIASDSLHGRDTATRDYDIAAEFVATMFSLWGIKPAGDFPTPSRRSFFAQPAKRKMLQRSYFQQVELKEIVKSDGKVVVEWQKGFQKKSLVFKLNVDYMYYARDSLSMYAPVVFVGYGIEEKELKFNEYKGVDVKGKIVMMLSETPRKGDKDSPFLKGNLKAKYYPPRRMRRGGFSKAKLAKQKGAIAVLMIENSPEKNGDIAERVLSSRKINDERPIFPGKRRRLSLIKASTPMPWETLPSIRISREMADKILDFFGKNVDGLKAGIEKELKPKSVELKGLNLTIVNKVETKLVNSPNVLGYIEGSDPELKKEVVVIGAHLDHLGKRGDYIFNGADDNGSGSASVMEIAEAFSKNKIKPKRSVLFALWTGEEKGLLGSRYYVENPFFPLNKTVANLNLDMVGREYTKEGLKRMSRWMGVKFTKDMLKKIDITNFHVPRYYEGSPEIYDALKQSSKYTGMSVLIRSSKTAMGGSDHAPFAMKKIPWAMFMANMTKDYHQPSDSFEKVSIKLIEKIARLVYLTAFQLANK